MVSIPKGTRDFGPEQMARRQRVFDIIRRQFTLFGFQPLETPAMENLSVLTGKYGEEGDRLIYKILNSGNYLEGISEHDLKGSPNTLAAKICERALRYDLTVPFARYVAMNKGKLTLPFRRYQMQPVWRADRPQKGRYREFYQCDADIVGTQSLVCEGELLALLYGVFSELGLGENVRIKLNSRKLLTALVRELDVEDKLFDFLGAYDKLDKIGFEKVAEELISKGFTSDQIEASSRVIAAYNGFEKTISNPAILDAWDTENLPVKESFKDLLNPIFRDQMALGLAIEGFEDLYTIIKLSVSQGVEGSKIEFDPTLARGLDYYTGAIIEVKALGVSIGSIAGGGRYDNLTAVFGVPDVPGVGVSFGIDRICDVLEELNLFGDVRPSATRVLICSMDEDGMPEAAELLARLRKAGIASELYPEASKLKRMLGYADKMGIGYAILLGSDERQNRSVTLRNLSDGSQAAYPSAEIVDHLQNLLS